MIKVDPSKVKPVFSEDGNTLIEFWVDIDKPQEYDGKAYNARKDQDTLADKLMNACIDGKAQISKK